VLNKRFNNAPMSRRIVQIIGCAVRRLSLELDLPPPLLLRGKTINSCRPPIRELAVWQGKGERRSGDHTRPDRGGEGGGVGRCERGFHPRPST
jgi:hypothetical protein